MWDYKNAYNGYEDLATFTGDELAKYRQHLLEKSRPQSKWIKERFNIENVLEIGCGNGRLLIDLAEGTAETDFYGSGIDVSDSRIKFAEKWYADAGINNLEFWVQDVLKPSWLLPGPNTLVICVTGTFGYFHPQDFKAPAFVLDRIKSSLDVDGAAVFELYNIPDKRKRMLEINNNHLRSWYKLAPEDKFDFYLEEFNYFPEIDNTMCHTKTFITKTGRVDEGRYEMLKYYSKEEFRDLALSVGFRQIDFHGALWTPDSEVVVVHA